MLPEPTTGGSKTRNLGFGTPQDLFESSQRLRVVVQRDKPVGFANLSGALDARSAS